MDETERKSGKVCEQIWNMSLSNGTNTNNFINDRDMVFALTVLHDWEKLQEMVKIWVPTENPETKKEQRK